MSGNLFDPPAIVRPAEDLAALAARINSEHESGEVATRRGLEHFRNAGEALLRAKEQCGHGKWLAWLKKNIRFSDRRAQRYMALAKSDVTSDLEEQWRAISGNAPPDELSPGPLPAETSATPLPELREDHEYMARDCSGRVLTITPHPDPSSNCWCVMPFERDMDRALLSFIPRGYAFILEVLAEWMGVWGFVPAHGWLEESFRWQSSWAHMFTLRVAGPNQC